MNIWDKCRCLSWFISTQFGIHPRKMIWFLLGMPRYIRDLFHFRSGYAGRLELVPCLHDWGEECGTVKDEYFWQDLIVARKIFKANPEKHVDIGSRVDGFVAHVASFRELEAFDVRPITTQIPGVKFRQIDLKKPLVGMQNYCDSLSCLHALEHFGLGRYGDAIDPKGVEFGLANMAKLLREDGVFYLSVPIGIGRVCFNANRVFDPHVITTMATRNSLKLSELTVVRENSSVEELVPDETQLHHLASQRYTLGIFTFVKSVLKGNKR